MVPRWYRLFYLSPVAPAGCPPSGASHPPEQARTLLLAGPSVHAGKGHSMSAIKCRSEEHTSELQSLMRISYAVFCLKKKLITNLTTVYITNPTYSSPIIYLHLVALKLILKN